MPVDDPEDPRDGDRAGEGQAASLLTRIAAEMGQRLVDVAGEDRRDFVSSELAAVHATLQELLDRDLARGMLFCEWGSGVGAVCAVAASLGFEANGIEIQPALVAISRGLLDDLHLEARFAHGSFLQPGDEELVSTCDHTCQDVSLDAYRELGFELADCDVVFAYPWPQEDASYDEVFLRHATPGALLITFHDSSRVLVQRRTDDDHELEALGWMGLAGA